MTIADRIRNKREELQLSQTELAKRAGYTDRTSISKIENMGNDITMKQIKRIAEALRVTPAYLMGWEDDPQISQLLEVYARSDFKNSITDNEVEILKRIRALEAVYTTKEIEHGIEFIGLFINTTPEIQSAVVSILKSQQHDS